MHYALHLTDRENYTVSKISFSSDTNKRSQSPDETFKTNKSPSGLIVIVDSSNGASGEALDASPGSVSNTESRRAVPGPGGVLMKQDTSDSHLARKSEGSGRKGEPTEKKNTNVNISSDGKQLGRQCE